MIQIKTVFAAALLTMGLAACNNPQSAPEPENEATAAAMPETPDRSDTAADETAAGMAPPAPTETPTAPATAKAEPEKRPGY